MREPKVRRWFPLAAAALLVAALGAGPSSAAAQSAPSGAQARQLYNAGRYRQAVQTLQAAVKNAPQDAALAYWLGRCDYELGDFNRAVVSLERAVAIEPGNSDYHDWLGRALGRKAEHSNPFSAFSLARKTHREFQTAVRLDRSNLAAQRDLIRYLLNAPGVAGGGDGHALQQIAALALVNGVEADLARAEYFQARTRLDLAGEQYEKVLQADPGRIGVYLEVADFYADQGDAGRMQKAIAAAASVAPSDPRLDYYRGAALVLANANPQEAEKHLRTYLHAVPDNSEVPSHAWAHEWLGRLYENQQRLEEAAREFQMALTLDPRNKKFREALKQVQQRQTKKK
jgi:tetratricopeptide (TPR) repeat protein